MIKFSSLALNFEPLIVEVSCLKDIVYEGRLEQLLTFQALRHIDKEEVQMIIDEQVEAVVNFEPVVEAVLESKIDEQLKNWAFFVTKQLN